MVWSVRSRQTGKRYLVKRYTRRRDALRERRVIVACAGHPNIVSLHRFYTRRGRSYVVLEWVDGMPLRRFIRRNGPLDPLKVIDVALEVLTGLEVVHSRGFIHGDLHSGNVIVSDIEAPRVTIIDFQHSVRKNASGRARSIRRLLRPPRKLAPETRRRIIDDRYDIYGVGFMCAHMLFGRYPRGRPRKAREAGENGPLWRVVRTAMHPIPARRFRSAAEMSEALRQVRELLVRERAAKAAAAR